MIIVKKLYNGDMMIWEILKDFKLLFLPSLPFLSLIILGIYFNDFTMMIFGLIVFSISVGIVIEGVLLCWWFVYEKNP